jgi:hypothetical protein
MARDERILLPFQRARGLAAQWIKHEHQTQVSGVGLQTDKIK